MKTEMKTKAPINERLKDWRARNDWTQRQAADYLGAAVETYRNWEQGRCEPRGATLKGIERAMGEY